MTEHTAPHQTDAPSAGPRFVNLLFSMLRHPQQLLLLWNWKSAVLSMVLRGPIFFVAAVRQGWEAAVGSIIYRVDILRFERRILRRGSADVEGCRAAVADRHVPHRSRARYLSGTGVFTTLVPGYASSSRGGDRFFIRKRCFRVVQLVRNAPRNSAGGERRRRVWRRPSPATSTSLWFLAVLPRKIAGRSQSRSSKLQSSIMCGDLSNGR